MRVPTDRSGPRLHRRLSHADADPHAHADPDANSDAHADAYSDADAHAYPDAHACGRCGVGHLARAAVASYVPASLRGSRFGTYITGASSWDDTPLYIFDEWVAYTNGSEVAVNLARAGLWRYGWRDGVAGTLEFTAYALALGMAVEAGDPAYFRDHTQFRAFLAWNVRRAMDLYRIGSVIESFRWDTQDAYYRALRESPDAEALRAFARRVYGRPWAAEVLGLAP